MAPRRSCIIGWVQDAIASYCAAAAAGDIDALMATLASDAELPSPVIGRARFRGQDDLRFLLGAVYGMLTELRWERPIGEGSSRVAVAHARVGGLRIDDAMVFELDEHGLIRSVRPHLRPLLALSLFALMTLPRIGRRPGVVLRAVRNGWAVPPSS
jgi:hypothetical protein